ncbi:MBL fold metallo-hydrolase RNA specificity domain-containing protein [Mahella australiensis]|uniref:RNA-metabolising metallo-beta-lactamase n=1 Tax=Mahella australiensis (strain DSM 15567 / CIP 107919 / 50-1 BON) TaxID=697281 RepID=F3ZXT2_MAHA5|nr:MBL fold metallo-hydrolase [Mahella australiensis]AEE96602.1 RNA-metabolising metallo-beta-lactamase [Mahella australiensis 50-1 BON]
MKVTFLGAARMVTGSCYLLENKNIKVLVDCGMFQGGKEEEKNNFMEFPVSLSDIDYLLLTHAHIDHSGRIPLLCKRGFKGKILSTKATVDLCSIMLPDSAHIQEMEAEWATRKAMRAGRPPVEPLYTVADAEYAMQFFEPVPYNNTIRLSDDISVRFQDAGHILGSAVIEIWNAEDNIKLVFSGDLGNRNQPIIKDPSFIDDADYVFVESTYGDRLHQDRPHRAHMLWDIIQNTFSKGGNVIIPAFAVGRTQELLYELNMVIEDNKAKNIPVYIDSPLAIKATEIFKHDVHEYYDSDALKLLSSGDDPLDFPGLDFTLTAEESKQLNFLNHSAVIIAASGMCDAGRIKHHLKHNLWRPESSVVFVGYQAAGTLGRRILDGAKMVKIFGEDIAVKAHIYSIDSFSAHADKNGLIDWMRHFKNKPKQVFVIHGEDDVAPVFATTLNSEFDMPTTVPYLGQVYELI